MSDPHLYSFFTAEGTHGTIYYHYIPDGTYDRANARVVPRGAAAFACLPARLAPWNGGRSPAALYQFLPPAARPQADMTMADPGPVAKEADAAAGPPAGELSPQQLKYLKRTLPGRVVARLSTEQLEVVRRMLPDRPGSGSGLGKRIVEAIRARLS